MDAAEVLKLFDSCWFGFEIFDEQPSSSNSKTKPDQEAQEEPSKPVLSRIQTHHVRSMSDQSSFTTSFNPGSLSPDTVLVPKLQPIFSGREIREEDSTETHTEEVSPTRVTLAGRRRKKAASKSLSDLEFEELKGFMDLGFVFSEEDKDSDLVSIIPGLQRLGKKDGEEDNTVDESAVPRPYLSEAWESLDRRKKENPLMNWRVPTLGSEIDMKDNLRSWAHTVASTVK